MAELTAPEELVWAAAFARSLDIEEARKAVQALREAKAGHSASRNAAQRMLADFRQQQTAGQRS